MVKRGGKNAVSKADKRRWKIGSAIIIVAFSVIVGLLLWLSYTGSSKEIVAVADQFKPDPSWQLKSEAIEQPRTFCGDVECPSVFRLWKTDYLLSKDEFQKLITISGWDFTINGDCKLNSNIFGTSLPICSASGVINSYQVNISIRGSNEPDSSQVSLNITKV